MSAAISSWRSRNPERVKSTQDRYVAENRAKVIEANRTYRRKLFADPALVEALNEHRRNKYSRERDKASAYRRAWRQKNLERARARDRAARQTDRHRAYTAKYCAENKDALCAKSAKRRAAKRRATIQIFTKLDLRARLGVYGGLCAYCRTAEWEHIDHVKPIALGGSHCLSNLRPACAHCNLSKHAMPAHDWLNRIGRQPTLPLP